MEINRPLMGTIVNSSSNSVFTDIYRPTARKCISEISLRYTKRSTEDLPFRSFILVYTIYSFQCFSGIGYAIGLMFMMSALRILAPPGHYSSSHRNRKAISVYRAEICVFPVWHRSSLELYSCRFGRAVFSQLNTWIQTRNAAPWGQRGQLIPHLFVDVRLAYDDLPRTFCSCKLFSCKL